MDFESRVFSAVADSLHGAVPVDYRANSALMAEVVRHALARQGIRVELVPCQVWYAAPQCDHVLGFTGEARERNGWDGHVVCATHDQFIDAATVALARASGAQLPQALVVPRLPVRSQAFGRWHLSSTERIWWHHPPSGVDTSLPPQLDTLVSWLGDRLDTHVRLRLDAPAMHTPALELCSQY